MITSYTTYIYSDDIITKLSSKTDFLFNKNDIKKDTNLIKEIYLSSGYYDISVSSSFEKYSDDKINLIFNIYEGSPYQISKIDFIESTLTIQQLDQF